MSIEKLVLLLAMKDATKISANISLTTTEVAKELPSYRIVDQFRKSDRNWEISITGDTCRSCRSFSLL
jgi:hypothetical protein